MDFESILYVADADLKNRVALQRAARLASHVGARLTVLYVIKAAPLERLASLLSVFEDDIENEMLHHTLLRHRRAALDAFIEATEIGVLPIETKVRQGVVTQEIYDEIADAGHDLVIKAAEASKSLSDKIFGTDDMQLLRSCPVPIWIKKAEDDDGEYRILAAVDFVHKGEKYGLEDEVLETAHRLAKSENAELHVVHAWHSGLEKGFLDHKDFQPWKKKSKIQERVNQLQEQVHQEFRDLVAHHASQSVTTQAHLLEGDPQEVILSTIEKYDIDLLILGATKRSNLEGFFLGSTAEDLLSATTCSVLAIRPIAET